MCRPPGGRCEHSVIFAQLTCENGTRECRADASVKQRIPPLAPSCNGDLQGGKIQLQKLYAGPRKVMQPGALLVLDQCNRIATSYLLCAAKPLPPTLLSCYVRAPPRWA